jgi:hypothetical protein
MKYASFIYLFTKASKAAFVSPPRSHSAALPLCSNTLSTAQTPIHPSRPGYLEYPVPEHTDAQSSIFLHIDSQFSEYFFRKPAFFAGTSVLQGLTTRNAAGLRSKQIRHFPLIFPSALAKIPVNKT